MTRIEQGIIGAAIAAAPVVWLLAFLHWQPQFDAFWPLNNTKDFLFLVILIPIVEELCFRGAIQPYLFKKTSERFVLPHISQANLITSALFASVHLIYHPIVWAAATFIPSLIFGWLREKAGQTWPAIAMHIYYNFGYFYFLSGF